MDVSVTYMGVELLVEGNYDPEQEATWTDPGFDESFEITKIMTKSGDDITELFATRIHSKGMFGVSMEDDLLNYVMEAIHDKEY
jgi:hypothetical protein